MSKITSGLFTSLDDKWTTPKKFFAIYNNEFNIDLDVAALQNSALCKNWYGPDHPNPDRRDALVQKWTGTVWLNPPYGRQIGNWMKKANLEVSGGGIVVVCLVPARTDTAWWHDYCMQHEIRFIRGRLKFGDGKGSAPFPSAIVIMREGK